MARASPPDMIQFVLADEHDEDPPFLLRDGDGHSETTTRRPRQLSKAGGWRRFPTFHARLPFLTIPHSFAFIRRSAISSSSPPPRYTPRRKYRLGRVKEFDNHEVRLASSLATVLNKVIAAQEAA